MPPLRRKDSSSEDARPAGEVRLTDLHVEPWPDGRRVRVHVSMTPFQQNPSLEAVISRPGGEEIARAAIIETAENRIVFTLHMRTPEVVGTYLLTTTLSYPELGRVDERTIRFELSQPAVGDE